MNFLDTTAIWDDLKLFETRYLNIMDNIALEMEYRRADISSRASQWNRVI